MSYIWQHLALAVLAVGVHRFAPQWVDSLARWSSGAASHPGRYFVGLVAVSVLAYVPLAIAFTPSAWSNHGPFAFQFSRPLLYAVYYFAGLGVGANGLERGLLAPEGMLTRRWGTWLTGAFASFLLWMGLMALAMTYRSSAPLALQIAAGISFALACTTTCFFVMAVSMRFGTGRSWILDGLAESAFGIYLVHYGFVVWLQYALLGVALFAIAKAMIVLGATLSLAWMTIAIFRAVPLGARLVGATHRVGFGTIPAGGLRPAEAAMRTAIGTSTRRELTRSGNSPLGESCDAIES